MILYLDTSALVKLYVSEAGTEEVMAAVTRAQAVASHDIAYVEAHAALARLLRESAVTESVHAGIKREFREDWAQLMRLELTAALADRAAEFAEAFALRAYDSIHLAAADHLHRHAVTPVTFACFDRRLNRAAGVLGLTLLSQP